MSDSLFPIPELVDAQESTTAKKIVEPVKNEDAPHKQSELMLYFKVLLIGMGIFGLMYFYFNWQEIPSPVNKAVADTSIILIGLSMLLTSIAYFWNFFDVKIIYRKHLGLIGFAFAVVHIWLSYGALERLFRVETWQQSSYWPILTGLIAAVIFAVMAIISNKFSAMHLGGRLWKGILRTGYIAMLLVLAHVVLLKSARWITWYTDGMQSPPSVSLLVSIFIIVVVVLRVIMWWSIHRKQKKMAAPQSVR